MTVLTNNQTDRFTTEELQELVADQQLPSVSIYLSMERKGAETRQNAIRLKNLYTQAIQDVDRWADQYPEEAGNLHAETLLKPVADLITDQQFLQHQSQGLALFISPTLVRSFRCPFDFEERVIVGDSFWIKPLLPRLGNGGVFYLLLLNQGGVQLLRGTRDELVPVELGDDIPTSLAEALRFDEFESHLQFHTGTGSQTDSGDRAAIYHGQGGADEASNTENILRFFRSLDNGVRDLLEGDAHPPLVLAGLPFLQGLYRQVNRYNELMAEGVDHDSTAKSMNELHEQGWQIVQPIFQQSQTQATDQYQHLHGTADQRAVQAIEKIVPAAYFQRVDSLFLLNNRPIWGTFQGENRQVQIHSDYQPGDKDLTNFAAIHTILNGGTVYDLSDDGAANELADSSPVAAILRY